MNYTIRKAETDTDIKAIADVAEITWHDTFDSLLKPGQTDYMIEKFQSYDVLLQNIRHDGYIYYIAEYNGDIIAYCGIHPEDEDKKLFISKIYVLPEYQRNGIATAFFNRLVDEYKARYDPFYLTVNKYNEKAIKTYLKLGFKNADSIVTDIGGGYVMDDYVMEYECHGIK